MLFRSATPAMGDKQHPRPRRFCQSRDVHPPSHVARGVLCKVFFDEPGVFGVAAVDHRLRLLFACRCIPCKRYLALVINEQITAKQV